MFNWFSLDYVYYPVSGIMWLWYKLFGSLLGPNNFFTWALSVMFLVFTLRAVLYKPFVKQIRTTRKMQELQPQIKAVQKKYGKDRQRMALEIQKLQKEHDFNPILGCLPMLAQVPVFLGLYHVLMSFNRTQSGFGRLGLSVEENRRLPNYFFSAADVGHFLDANLFRAPIGAAITQQHGIAAFTEFSRPAVAAVSIPLMILAGIATYFNSRASISRQSPEAAANPQTAIMNKLALYVFPLGVVVGGPFLPIAIIIYWVSNNIWTFAQQHLVFGKIEREEEAAKEEALARRAANAPAPGAKPVKNRKATVADVAAAELDGETATDTTGGGATPAQNQSNGNGSAAAAPPRGATARRAPSRAPQETQTMTGLATGQGETMTEIETQHDETQHDGAQHDATQDSTVVGNEDTAAPKRKGTDLEERLVAEGEIAGDYLEELLDLLDFDGDIDLDVEGDRAIVSIDGGSDLNKLVGRRGEVLDALQELTRLAVLQKSGERSRLMLDIGGWRRRRRDELSALGEKVAHRVLESGQREELAPMTPFERKIVHDAVAGVSGVHSESEGVEPSRRVVVLKD
jgi:YidC/Oxa1 family membrane protein insertase